MINSILSVITADCTFIPEHHHSSLKVVLGIYNTYDCMIQGTVIKDCSGYIINQDVMHEVSSENELACLVCFVHPNSIAGQALRKRLNNKPFELLDISSQQYESYKEMTDKQLIKQIEETIKLLISPFVVAFPEEHPLINKIRAKIREQLKDKLLLESIAQEVNLSAHRTRHLFKEQTGMALTQFILWERIRAILHSVIAGNQFAVASTDYGFTDQPHFNKIFKRIFGITPTVVTDYCRMISI